ncbi:MAG: hypothetical protein KGZ94_08460 [Clostridia bacterium]|nr:hypothetical protein [Clostridia bacterium]
MKKLMYALIFILLFIMASCSVNTEPSSNNQEVNTNGSVSKEPLIMETEKYTVDKVEFAISNFEPINVGWFDDENIAVVMTNHSLENPPSKLMERIYVYNLKNKHYTLIAEGEFFGYNWHINFKKLLDGNFLLEGSRMALEIESGPFNFKGNLPYPEGAYEGDISHNKTQLVYNKKEGLYLHTLNSTSSKDAELYKYDDEEEIVPSSPAWSFDDKNIGYILFNRLDLSLNEVVILDPIIQKQKSYIVGESAPYGWWFQDNMRFVTYSSGIGVPIIKVIDTSKDQVQEYEKTGSIVITCPPHGDQVLYIHIDRGAESGYLMDRIVSFNVLTNTSDIVTPDFLNIRSSSFSPTGNQVLFIANSNPGEELSIYVARRKTNIILNN